jgi:hypothetical protein
MASSSAKSRPETSTVSTESTYFSAIWNGCYGDFADRERREENRAHIKASTFHGGALCCTRGFILWSCVRNYSVVPVPVAAVVVGVLGVRPSGWGGGVSIVAVGTLRERGCDLYCLDGMNGKGSEHPNTREECN